MSFFERAACLGQDRGSGKTGGSGRKAAAQQEAKESQADNRHLRSGCQETGQGREGKLLLQKGWKALHG